MTRERRRKKERENESEERNMQEKRLCEKGTNDSGKAKRNAFFTDTKYRRIETKERMREREKENEREKRREGGRERPSNWGGDT